MSFFLNDRVVAKNPAAAAEHRQKHADKQSSSPLLPSSPLVSLPVAPRIYLRSPPAMAAPDPGGPEGAPGAPEGGEAEKPARRRRAPITDDELVAIVDPLITHLNFYVCPR